MDRTRQIFTHGWVGASALNLFTGGYYPATVGPLAQGRVCLSNISFAIPGAAFVMGIPGVAVVMAAPSADMVMSVPNATMTVGLPGATIEMESTCD